LNKWTTGTGDAFTESDISDSIVLENATRVAERGWLYVGGLDLGLTKDAAALVVVGKHVGWTEEVESDQPKLPTMAEALIDTGIIESDLTKSDEPSYHYHVGSGRLRLCQLHLALPGGKGGRVSIDEIETAIIGLNAMLPLSCVAADPWQAALLIERLNKQGVPTEPVDFTGSNLKSMAMATLDAFTQREIELYDEPTLLADLRNLRVVERSYGFRLESPRTNDGNGTRHGDTATALSLALHIARRFDNETRTQITGDLLCWP
jgi:phage terminase large subunit-like protein